MQVSWQQDDIKPGRRVGRPGRTERWMIGYTVGIPRNSYHLVSLSDGMVGKAFNKLELAEQLNASGELPEEIL